MRNDPAGLLPLLYEAPITQEGWRKFLHKLSRQVAAKSAVLVAQDQQRCSLELHCGLDPDAHQKYQSYYGGIDTFYSYAKQRGFNRPGIIVPAQAFVTEKELLKTEYCNDFLLKFDILQHCFALLDTGSAAPTVLTLMRGRRERPFAEHEVRLLRFLAPHVQRAIQLHSRIQALEQKTDASMDVLEHLQQGVILLDGNAHVLMVNEAARSILTAEKSFKLTSHGFVLAISSESKRLSALIHGAIATGKGNSSHSGGTMNISRSGMRRPLQVLVTPLAAGSIYWGRDIPLVAIFISDPERKPVFKSQMLARLHGFTPAEARLAQILAGGDNLKDASAKLGVAESTVRSQLKSIFSKTSTNRQSELIRILLSIPDSAKRSS